MEYRKRTTSNARSDREGSSQPREHRFRKDKVAALPKRAAAPLPRLPPSLDIEIRNSLILPSLTQRFSVLLPGLAAAPDQTVRSLLAQQRGRNDGPSLTLEEEELLIAELRGGDAPSVMSGISEWDGNPPPLDGDWGYENPPRTGSLTGSMSSPSVRSRSGSDLGTLSTSARASATHLSPSGSFTPLAPVKSPSYSTFGGERIGPRSYGFSSSAGFRDNNYLRKVTKTAGKPADGAADTPTPHYPSPPRRKPLPDMYPPMPTLTDPDASSSPSSSSDRTALPSAHVSTSSVSGGSVTSPVTSTPQSPKDEVLIQRPQKTTPLDARGPHPRQRLHQLKQQPPPQRQSLMMGLSPAQAQRISMALLELESHLVSAVEVPEEHSRGTDQGSYVVLNDQEEILDGDGRGEPIVLDRVPSIASTSASSSVFPFTVSPPSSAHGGSASVAPSTAAPPTPVSKPPSLPSSPRALNLQAMQSAAGQSPTLASASFPAVPAGMQSPSPSPAASAPDGADVYRVDESTRVSSATTSLSDTDYPVPAPALKPFRPQPVRHTPSPAFGVTSGYVPGQPRPVGSRHGGHGSFSSKSSTPPFGSPLSPSAMNGIGQLPTRTPFPSAPTGQRRSGYSGLQGGVQLARSHSATQGSNAGSRSNTPTQNSKVDHVPAPGALAARHQTSHSIGEFNSWRSGSSLGVHSPSKAVILEDEQAERSASSHSSRRPPTEITSNLYSHGSIGRTSEAIGLFPMKDPSAQPLAPLQRVRTHESTSSTFSMPGMDDSTLWDSLFRDRPSDHAALITPNGDQDRADLDLLRSMSGMGKDELMLIQGRLVEKAKSERDKLRSERDEDVTPSPQPSQPPLSAPETHVPTQKSSAAASAASLPATLSKSSAWPMPPTAGPAVHPVEPSPSALPARLDNGVTAQFPGPPTSPSQFPTQHVPRSELPRGPPPMRPQPPPANISPVPVSAASMSPTVVTPSSLPPWAVGIASPTSVASPAAASPTANTNGQNGHDRSGSGGKTWLDEDPDARRDIEERIHQANSSLFRAPSRSAHKRSLSKKQISSPTLVSSSAKVPTTPIASIPGVADQGSLGKKSGEKGSSGHKLSGRWRKLGFKRPSISGAEVTPFIQPPMPAATVPLSGPLATTQKQQPQQTVQPTPPASLSRKPEGTDLHGFRFPHAPDGVPGSQNGRPEMPPPNGVVTKNTSDHDSANGRAVPAPAPPVLASQPRSGTPPPHMSALPSQSPPIALTRGSPGVDARTAPTAEVRPASPKGQRSKPLTGAALQAITNPSLEKVVSRRTHGTTPSDASIDKFIQAGREVGFDDERLNEILASNGVRHSDASSSLSRLSSVPLSPLSSSGGARSSPKAAPRLTLGWGHGDIDTSQFVISQFDSPPPTQPFFDKSQLDQVASSFDPPPSERSISGRLHPPGRIPSTVDESPRLTERALSEPRASSDIDPSILRRTIVMVDEAATPGAPLSPQVSQTGVGSGVGGGGRKLPPSPLQLANNDAVQTARVSPTAAVNGSSNGKAAPFQRGNSIRRKPVPLANMDKQSVEPSPRPGLHIRTESNTSDAMSSLVSPSPHYDGSHYYGNSEPASATSSGFPHSTSSFLDYYNGDSPVSETFERGSQFGSQQFNRGSQGLEITEYADGRVVWNIVNALRSDVGHGSASEDHTNNQQELQRGSVLSTQSQTSNYTGSQRESQPPERLSEVAEGGPPANGPWRVGPTAGLSFMRRPETKVYYTSSADVADLIDQLSGDATGGATRGRIDIRPTQMGVPQYGALGFGPGQFDDADLAPGAGQDLSTSTATLSPLKQRRLRPDLEQNFTAKDVQSPSAQSFGSDLSGGGSASVGHGGMERSVEDRLQALMDRLRAAPGGVSGVVVE